MAEGILMGAALGAGTSALSGNDPLKGAAIGGAMGGATAGFGGAGVDSAGQATAQQFGQTASHVNPALTGGVGGSTTSIGNTMNPALTNGLGQSSNAFTQFGRDASQMATNAYDTVGDTVGQGFDYMNDMTGMENRDWTQMGINQGLNSMQPDPQQQLNPAPMGQGISRPQVDFSKQSGSLLSSNPLTSGPGGMQMTQKDYELLKRGLL